MIQCFQQLAFHGVGTRKTDRMETLTAFSVENNVLGGYAIHFLLLDDIFPLRIVHPIMIAFQVGNHVAPGVFGRSVSGHVNICHIFACKLGFQRFHFFVCLSARTAPRCPKIHQHHFTGKVSPFRQTAVRRTLAALPTPCIRFLLVLLYFYQHSSFSFSKVVR